jgi:chromosomal replication initiator protein
MLPPEMMAIWNQVLEGLARKVNRQSYDHWLRPLRPIAYHNNTILIEVPNNFTRDWLMERYALQMKQSLEQLAGHEVALKFVLSNEVPEIQKQLGKNPPPDKWQTDLSALNPKYTFDSFVIGNSNRFAHAAAFAVADTPVKTYNPLFLYGGVGLGKTHLMHAIGHHILQQHSSRYRVGYVTSERFTNELINAIKDDETTQFRNKYRSIDILLIDDIQFLAGKERTQEEFFHTFNSLYEDHKQIVISSDRPPKDIPTLEERLRSRFEWGLIADIQPPDLETRIAILRKKNQAAENNLVPDETLAWIADRIQSNIRELEGAFVRVSAYASLTGSVVTPEKAAEVLKDILPPHKPRQITCPMIQQEVAAYFKLRPEEFKAKKRTRAVAYPRQIAMYLTRELTDLSLPKIGEEFGGRDHTTVIHACEKIAREIQDDPSLQEMINEIMRRIQKQ